MPNWCNNNLQISHTDKAMIERVLENKKEFLQAFIPCPQDLLDGEGWYNWRVENWGTKWDVCLDILEESQDSLIVSFESAWAPPIEAYAKLEGMGFKIDALYFEPGCEFVGKYKDGNDTQLKVDFSKDEWRHLPRDLVDYLEPYYGEFVEMTQESI